MVCCSMTTDKVWVLCVVSQREREREIFAPGWSEKSYRVRWAVWDREASTVRKPLLTRGCYAMEKQKVKPCQEWLFSSFDMINFCIWKKKVLRIVQWGTHRQQHRCKSTYDFLFNPLTPNDLQRRRALSPLKIKITSKNVREKPTNTPTIH
jgi:hypothetical protein